MQHPKDNKSGKEESGNDRQKIHDSVKPLFTVLSVQIEE